LPGITGDPGRHPLERAMPGKGPPRLR